MSFVVGWSCWSIVHGSHCHSLYVAVSVLCQGALQEVGSVNCYVAAAGSVFMFCFSMNL